MTDECPMARQHCWHNVGGPIPTKGGTSTERCCWCGVQRTLSFDNVAREPVQHGPHTPYGFPVSAPEPTPDPLTFLRLHHPEVAVEFLRAIEPDATQWERYGFAGMDLACQRLCTRLARLSGSSREATDLPTPEEMEALSAFIDYGATRGNYGIPDPSNPSLTYPPGKLTPYIDDALAWRSRMRARLASSGGHPGDE